ncbi:MAG TPA: hypothetical protein VL971_00315 [Rhizomicrobium sp.]|nr:hypothetical protein [Rhizomicrobium sp.]
MIIAKDYSQMDAALAFLDAYGPDLSNGFTNHAPMVTEALSAMGRADAVMPWLTQNWPLRDLLMPRVDTQETIDPESWQRALNNDDPVAWTAFFQKELAAARWEDVVAGWGARLAPGINAGAAHGVIRTGHAVRSLSEHENPARLHELAGALGYWASCYETLPVADYSGAAMTARDAIMCVPFSPGDARTKRGGFTTGLRSLNDFTAFAPVIGMLDVRGNPAAIISDLTETFTRVYLANAHDAYTVIAFIHGVTACAALRSIAPYLDTTATRAALRYAWQTGAALYSVYGTVKPDWSDIAQPREAPDELIARAVATGDDHAIKFMEACLREYAIRPSGVYLAAARHAAAMLGAG